LRSNDENQLETTIANGVLAIETRTSEGWLGRNTGRIDVMLAIPRDAAVSVTAKTGLGDVKVEGVSGVTTIHTGKGHVHAAGGASPLTIKTGKGDVSVRQWRGDLQLTTGKGDTSVNDLVGGLQMTTGAGDTAVARWQANGGAHQIKTGSGDITVSQAHVPTLEVVTGRGDCTLQQVGLRSLRARTGYGDLMLAGDPSGGRWEARTGKGDLTLALAEPAAARVEAATRHGSIQSELPQVRVARPGPASQHGGRTIVVTGEEPRAEILLETGKGDIIVRMAGPAPAAVAQPPTQVTVEAPQALQERNEPSIPQITAMSVLESLARGEISVDEAETLLRSLEEG
jgi:DUF4097 and DUF4098 domain-containing protein YvlB